MAAWFGFPDVAPGINKNLDFPIGRFRKHHAHRNPALAHVAFGFSVLQPVIAQCVAVPEHQHATDELARAFEVIGLFIYTEKNLGVLPIHCLTDCVHDFL